MHRCLPSTARPAVQPCRPRGPGRDRERPGARCQPWRQRRVAAPAARHRRRPRRPRRHTPHLVPGRRTYPHTLLCPRPAPARASHPGTRPHRPIRHHRPRRTGLARTRRRLGKPVARIHRMRGHNGSTESGTSVIHNGVGDYPHIQLHSRYINKFLYYSLLMYVTPVLLRGEIPIFHKLSTFEKRVDMHCAGGP